MRALFGNTVSAICYSIVREESQGLGPSDRERVSPNAVVNFVLDQHRRMPDYLQRALLLLTICFAITGLFYGGSMFHRLSPASRSRQIATWRQSRIRAQRDFVRLYDGLAVFCWYSMVMSPGAAAAPSRVTAAEPLRLPADASLFDAAASAIADAYKPA